MTRAEVRRHCEDSFELESVILWVLLEVPVVAVFAADVLEHSGVFGLDKGSACLVFLCMGGKVGVMKLVAIVDGP